jgi:glycosyltransferase involved in cell wall biosynthesis
MKNILIVETEYEGHHLTGYIKYILRSFKGNEVNIVLLTSDKALKQGKGPMDILKREDVHFDIETIKYINFNSKNIITKILYHFKIYFLVKKKFQSVNQKYKFDHIFLTSMHKFYKSIAIFGSPFGEVAFSGIFLGAKFHLRYFNINSYNKFNFILSFLFKIFLYQKQIYKIIVNDNLFLRYLKKKKYKNFHKIKFLHDPKEFNFKNKKNIARKKLGLPKKDFFILVYGTLIESKGIKELLEIFKSASISDDIKVILAGEMSNWMLKYKKEKFIEKLINDKKLFIFDGWQSEKRESFLFDSCDVVWIGYKRYVYPSGVLYQAVCKKLPVLISNDGFINHLNKIIKIGYSINLENVKDILNKIELIKIKKNYFFFKTRIIRFSKISSAKNWVDKFKYYFYNLNLF